MRTVAVLVAAIVSTTASCGPIQIGSSREADAHSAGAPSAAGAPSGGRGAVASAGRSGTAGSNAGGVGDAGRQGMRPSAGAGSGAAGTGSATVGAGAGGSDGGSPAAAGAAGTPDTDDGGEGGVAGCDQAVSVTGRVTSPTGAPLSGITITVSADDSVETTTDASGYYAVNGRCPGAHTVTPSFDGLKFCRAEGAFETLDRDTTQDFTGSPGGCEAAIERRLLLLIYDPSVDSGDGTPLPLSVAKGWEDPATLVRTFVSKLEAVTNGHVRYDADIRTVATFPPGLDGFRYGASDYLECLADSSLCHESEFVDYDSIVDEEAICMALEDGDADEAWLLGGPHFGFAALRTYTSCRRVVDLAGFDYAAGLAGMFAAFQTRSEAAFSQIFASAEPSPLEQFQQAATEPNGLVSGCGSAHASPNAASGHPFDSLEPVASYCDAYYDFPLTAAAGTLAQPVTCADWGCSEFGYRSYWLRHVPRARGLDADGWLADWWRYVLDPDERRGRSELSCSSSYTSGWCENLLDGHYGECNVGEWAMPKRNSGSVDFHWFSERVVTHVEVYDRACNERVLKGHLEFSDGSIPIDFGPLDDTGMRPEVIDFEPKTLSGLSVFIDESYGLNPGFAEIVVN